MRALLLTSIVWVFSVTASTSKYQTGDEAWSSKLLLDTCKREITSAINHVRKPFNKKVKYVAIMPEELGYQYFNVVFKPLENGIALPENTSRNFTHQFQYWTKSDEHTDCTRVEPTEFIH